MPSAPLVDPAYVETWFRLLCPCCEEAWNWYCEPKRLATRTVSCWKCAGVFGLRPFIPGVDDPDEESEPGSKVPFEDEVTED